MEKQKWRQIFDILKTRFTGTDIVNTAILIAFYLLLALFPLAIAIGNLLPYFNIDPASVMDYLHTVVPEAVQTVLDPVIEGLLTSSSGGLLSFGIIAAIWSSSKGVSHIQRGCNNAYGISATSSVITKRLISIMTILLILVLVAVFVLVFVFGQMILEWVAPVLPWAQSVAKTIGDLKWPVALVFLFVMFTLIYWVAPDVKLRFRDALPGAALTTVGMLLLSQVFSLYLQFAARSFTTYGALGTFFVLMFWLEFTAILIIAGAVLNASIGEYKFGAAQEEVYKVDTYIKKTKTSLLGRIRQFFLKKKK